LRQRRRGGRVENWSAAAVWAVSAGDFASAVMKVVWAGAWVREAQPARVTVRRVMSDA